MAPSRRRNGRASPGRTRPGATTKLTWSSAGRAGPGGATTVSGIRTSPFARSGGTRRSCPVRPRRRGRGTGGRTRASPRCSMFCTLVSASTPDHRHHRGHQGDEAARSMALSVASRPAKARSAPARSNHQLHQRGRDRTRRFHLQAGPWDGVGLRGTTRSSLQAARRRPFASGTRTGSGRRLRISLPLLSLDAVADAGGSACRPDPSPTPAAAREQQHRQRDPPVGVEHGAEHQDDLQRLPQHHPCRRPIVARATWSLSEPSRTSIRGTGSESKRRPAGAGISRTPARACRGRCRDRRARRSCR